MTKQRGALPRETADQAGELRRYEGALRKYFGRRLRNAQEVDDLVQETFARLLASGQRDGVREPVAYLFRIASNLLADHGRRQARRPGQAEYDEETSAVPVAPTQEDARHLADLHKLLDQALAELSPTCRRVFVMRRFQDMGTAAIADQLVITSRMVQKHLARAMTHMFLRLTHHNESDF